MRLISSTTPPHPTSIPPSLPPSLSNIHSIMTEKDVTWEVGGTGRLYTKILTMFQDGKILVMQILFPFCSSVFSNFNYLSNKLFVFTINLKKIHLFKSRIKFK